MAIRFDKQHGLQNQLYDVVFRGFGLGSDIADIFHGVIQQSHFTGRMDLFSNVIIVRML